MKKFLMTCALVVLATTSAGAAPQSECAYSPRQMLIRDARDSMQIENLIAQGVVFDETPRCGGSLMQLAIRRGNPEVLKALLQQDLKRANQIVSLDEFPIPGAPKKVPLWLFAAYYAPNDLIINLMQQALQQSGANLAMVDDSGRNALWYMERNPVLRQTTTYDNLNALLLTSLMASSQDLQLNAAINPGLGGNLSIPVAAQPKGNAPAVPSQAAPTVLGSASASQKVVLEPTK